MIHVRDDWDVEFWENSTEAFDILHEQEKKPSQMCRDPSLREHVARILQWHVALIVIRVTLIRIFL